MSEREFDVVVFGASGYTGKLVAEYIQSEYGENGSVKWAIAGRNREKLEGIREELGLSADLSILEVDSNDQDSLNAMTSSTKCVLTTVGPYQLYGSNLVQSCAKNGTDYVDLTGEPGWMYEMINAHKETAQASGARIVFSCGFDSIPFDLGVYFVQQAAMDEFGKPAQHVRGRVKAMNGEFSGGTIASLGATMATLKKKPELIKVLANPFSLTEGFEGPAQLDDSKVLLDEKLNMWVAPFVMAPINTKNIHRSNALLDHQYGEDFCYDEMMIAGEGEEGKQIADAMTSANPMGGDNVPQPGEGPSKESREQGNYDVLFFADLGEESIEARVTGDMDPGYGSTSKMITESAICLIQDCSDLPGGIYTPAPAMGDKLIQRLEKKAGLTFDII
ncbi:saccharopine dehydrogenase NADP-binding domain-containing protein [Gammaproteobacteria bacterium]|nr:saccharopine dehydrogenase NADP-binding domain-containing protein [Gammaproteobacteria bacterium]